MARTTAGRPPATLALLAAGLALGQRVGAGAARIALSGLSPLAPLEGRVVMARLEPPAAGGGAPLALTVRSPDGTRRTLRVTPWSGPRGAGLLGLSLRASSRLLPDGPEARLEFSNRSGLKLVVADEAQPGSGAVAGYQLEALDAAPPGAVLVGPGGERVRLEPGGTARLGGPGAVWCFRLLGLSLPPPPVRGVVNEAEGSRADWQAERLTNTRGCGP